MGSACTVKVAFSWLAGIWLSSICACCIIGCTPSESPQGVPKSLDDFIVANSEGAGYRLHITAEDEYDTVREALVGRTFGDLRKRFGSGLEEASTGNGGETGWTAHVSFSGYDNGSVLMCFGEDKRVNDIMLVTWDI